MTIKFCSSFRLAAAFAPLALLLSATAAAQAAHAPHFPTGLSPTPGAAYEGRDGITPIAISWGQLLTTGPTVRPQPTYFVICFKAYTSSTMAPSCTPADATWIEQITAPSPQLTRVGNTFSFVAARRLQASEVDRQLRVTVGACALFSCSYTSAAVWYSTKNIAAGDVDDDFSNGSNWVIDVYAGNTGSTAIAQYEGNVGTWEVLGEGNPGRTCATDVDSPTYRFDTTLWAIDERGVSTPIGELTRVNNQYVGPRIVGIRRFGAPYLQRSFTTRVTSLAAGPIADVPVAQVAFPIADAGQQRTFVMVARHDTYFGIREFNEQDNQKARCIRR